jgi:hypothetical protein
MASRVLSVLMLMLVSAGCVTVTQPPRASVEQTKPKVQTVQRDSDLPPASSIKPAEIVVPRAPSATPNEPARVKSRGNLAGDWTPPVKPNRWLYIVIHHSAADAGNAAIIDQGHRQRGFDELGYHFVIGNGTKSGNGEIEVGPRWRTQKWGAHAKTPDERYNKWGIGICLVGNFEDTRPTAQQLQSLARIVAWLQNEYDIPSSRIIGHRDTKPTACPGKLMDIASVRTMAGKLIADAGLSMPTDTVAARDGELLQGR